MSLLGGSPTEESGQPSILAMSRSSLSLWLAVFIAGCTALTWIYGPAEWGLIRIGIGGVLLGMMSFYMLFINRLLVS